MGIRLPLRCVDQPILLTGLGYPAQPGRAPRIDPTANLAVAHVLNRDLIRPLEIVREAVEDDLSSTIRLLYSNLKKSMGKEQELIVITRTYDLILWCCNHTSKFPRNHRFVLGE
jgi:hypothetical protein